jgi:hypothetical protein
MDQRYRILFTGQLQSGADVEEVVERLVVTFKIPAAQARLLVRDGNRHLIKKDLDEADAQRYRAVLEKAGMIVQVESMEPSAKTPTQAPLEGEPAEVTASPKPVRCRACGSTRMEDGVCRDCGVVREKYVARQLASSDQSIHQNGLASEGSDPYSTPRADLSPQPREGKMRGPYRVPAGHGWSWIARGFWHFKVNSLAWILAFLVLLGISIVLSLIPLIGGLANSLLAAVFIAGLMYGSREQEQGGDFRVEHLVAGFRENLGPLALVGLLYLVGSVLIGIVILVLLLGSMMPMLDMSPEKRASVPGLRLGCSGTAHPGHYSPGIGLACGLADPDGGNLRGLPGHLLPVAVISVAAQATFHRREAPLEIPGQWPVPAARDKTLFR